MLAHLVIPEAIESMKRADGASNFFPFFENSSHALDLVRYLFDHIDVTLVRHLRSVSGALAGFGAIFESHRGDVIHVIGNWGAPSNFSLTIDRLGKRVEMRPFEMALIYDGMEILPPSEEFPIRRYVPKVSERVLLDEIDYKEKPGFAAQAREFSKVLNGGRKAVGATLSDALEVVQICQKIIRPS